MAVISTLSASQAQTIKNAERFLILQGGANYAYAMIDESRARQDMEGTQLAHEMLYNINCQISRHDQDYTHPSGAEWDTELANLVIAQDPYSLGR